MENFIIENNKDELIFKLKKSDFDSNFILSLIKNLETESLAQRSGFDESILSIAEEIKSNWWKQNRDEYMKDVSI
ncbi:MAG: hypothetical protein KIT33_07285 [Candidatus Kapabacteria bacterium]|nr:hypothetical protein [Ignavibacteriota bacterium]MCW5884757.1 hypothetical protein [Candidatus Kapabacteria bacterium]